MMELVNYYLIPGLVIGSIYALGAVGISMIFGILRFAHFAHGDLMTLAAYATLATVWALSLPPLAALPVGIVVACITALAADHIFYRPLRKLPTIYTVISSFGVALMLRATVQLVWGPQNQVYVAGVKPPLVLFDALRLKPLHGVIVISTAVIAVLLSQFLTRSRLGKSMRAVADDAELAGVAGIDAEHVVRWTWILGAALAAVAGVFAAADTNVNANVGWNLLLPCFAAALLGGIGKPMGAMLGGLILGLVEELSSYTWIGDWPLVSPGYKTAIAFLVMVVLLLFRPQGLMKGRLL